MRDRLPPQPTSPSDDSTSALAVLVDERARRAAAEFAGLSFHGTVSDSTGADDVIDLFGIAAFASGREPYARTTWLDNLRDDAALRAAGDRLVREYTCDQFVERLWTGDGWTLQVTRWPETRRARLLASARTADLLARVIGEASADAVTEPPVDSGHVPIGFWHQAGDRASRINRRIQADSWDDIRRNYASRTAGVMDRLMELTADSTRGRLLLLHGPPGTGKTTLLRTLARQWRSWCQVDCVLDPERLFASSSYLLEIALGAGGPDGEDRWRLLLLEDCDELIRAEAKNTSGQALSRLLNLTDGLLGQGRKVLIAVTTNEDLARLHPAVTRPGRSLAQVEVGRFSPAECRAWLGDGTALPADAHRDGATLAELYAARAGTPALVVEPESTGFGTYL